MQMVDLDTVRRRLGFDSSQIAQLREGQKAAIRLRSGREYRGEVVRLNAEADPVTRELEVDVKFGTVAEPRGGRSSGSLYCHRRG